MVKFSRYILVLSTILALAISLPGLYWTAFDKPVRKPFIMYSCTENDFMILRNSEKTVREDTRGNTYTREQYEERLPFMYLRQLMISGTMKDTINGKVLDVHEINMNKSFFSFKPTDMVTPVTGLYPLFESQSGRANIEMPEDFFRITWRMEFIEAKTDMVAEEKSRMFSAALFKKGFEFPALSIAGIPTTRKSCDEGYLVTDNKNGLFHVKMVKGKPYVRKIDIPAGLIFKHIACVDFKDLKYYAYLFDTMGEIYILTQEDYELIRFPAGNFHPEQEELRIYGDLFNYNVIISGDGFVRAVVLDKEYRKIREYNEKWPVRSETVVGKTFAWLFPGQLSLTNEDSNFIRFYFTLSKGFKWLIISTLLLIIHFLTLRKKNKISRHWVDFGLIMVSGIFGFIAVKVFPNKFYD
jgi:hypothetical protein